MWIRKEIEVGWRDLGTAIGCCFRKEIPDFSECWPESDPLPFLSVRSGFDCLLGSVDWPAGSEILISGFTIECMPRIIAENGYAPVPLDLDERALVPGKAEMKAKLTSKTRAIVVAHLFGMRSDMTGIAEFAATHNLILIEDCAQNFVGQGYSGFIKAQVSMFSFGPIKTCTALGGALFQIRDAGIRERLQSAHCQLKRQRARDFFRRIIKYGGIKLLSPRRIYGALYRFINWYGGDFDALIGRAGRGFAGRDFFDQIRKQPSFALMRFLETRLNRFSSEKFLRRNEALEILRNNMDASICNYGENSAATCEGEFLSTHWMIPVMSDDNHRMAAELKFHGFDASVASSLKSLGNLERAGSLPVASRLEAKALYLPTIDSMTKSEITKLATLVNRDLQQQYPSVATSRE